MLRDSALHGGVMRIHGTGVPRSGWTPAFSHGYFMPFGSFLGSQWFSKDYYIHKKIGVSELFLKLCEWRPPQRRL